jgi:hypothetical protein
MVSCAEARFEAGESETAASGHDDEADHTAPTGDVPKSSSDDSAQSEDELGADVSSERERSEQAEPVSSGGTDLPGAAPGVDPGATSDEIGADDGGTSAAASSDVMQTPPGDADELADPGTDDGSNDDSSTDDDGDDDSTDDEGGAEPPVFGDPPGATTEPAPVDPSTPPIEETPISTSPEPTEEEPAAGLVLSVVFDIAASMGIGTQAYYDRALKWDPVLAGTAAFFETSPTTQVDATLTLFPSDAAGTAGGGATAGAAQSDFAFCDASEYTTPNVGLTALPSTIFAETLNAANPPGSAEWRVGTPTLAVVQATIALMATLGEQRPGLPKAVLLITDGIPQHCEAADNDVSVVAAEVAGVADLFPTYVIAIDNPVTEQVADPPDTISGLEVIATAGGTELIVIDTTDSTATAAAIAAALEAVVADASH